MKEFTIRAVLLGIILALILGVANTWLGLYAGMTVSASIPAAVISMAILRGLLSKGTILENNIVQSIASAGESLAAGVIFTVPAMLLIGAWQDFAFWPTTLIALCGGLLGVVFMVPLRHSLMNKMPHLVFPEGHACAKVLAAGDNKTSDLKWILISALTGIVYKLLSSLSGLMKSGVSFATKITDRFLISLGSDFSPALLAVGYIVRLPIAALLFAGGFIGSGIFLTLSSWMDMPSGENATRIAADLWSTRVRFLGVGAMLVGGLQSLIEVLWKMRGSFFTMIGKGNAGHLEQENDISAWSLLVVFIAAILGTFFLYDSMIGQISTTIIIMLILIPSAFLFVAVAAYTVGLVGSSNSPVSGMTICVLLLTAGVLLALGIKSDSLPMAILGVAGVVCCATATAGDIAQDLKTGQIVGAKPKLQQWGEVIGIVATAPVFAFTLHILHNGPGIGTNQPGSLPAPQAGLFAALTQGILKGDLPINLVLTGASLGLLFLLLDLILKKFKVNFRVHLMPLAVGIYLPMSITVPIFLGGLVRFFTDRYRHNSDTGILFGSGLIAGEAITGIAVAFIGGAGTWVLFSDVSIILQNILGMIVFGLLIYFFYFVSKNNNK